MSATHKDDYLRAIKASVLAGYPHAAEADLLARHVLPRIEHGPLAA